MMWASLRCTRLTCCNPPSRLDPVQRAQLPKQTRLNVHAHFASCSGLKPTHPPCEPRTRRPYDPVNQSLTCVICRSCQWCVAQHSVPADHFEHYALDKLHLCINYPCITTNTSFHPICTLCLKSLPYHLSRLFNFWSCT